MTEKPEFQVSYIELKIYNDVVRMFVLQYSVHCSE